MHTVEPIVVRSPLGWDPVSPRRVRPWLPAAIVGGFFVVVLAVSSLITLPYYALAPGSARDVGELISANGVQTYPAKGEVLLTTITLGKVTALEAVIGWARADVDVVNQAELIPPDTTDADYRRFNEEVMDDSKQTAIVVALRRLGYQVTERGDGALVERVLSQFPSNGRLEPGEVIKKIDGQTVTLVQEATALIGMRRPGDVLHLEVAAPDGSRVRNVDVPLVADPEQGGKAVLGVFLRTSNRGFDLPFPVEISSDSIGGPSAGLAFALGVIDQLTEGELTGGRKIAVTGTIEIDGRVGDVGGVAQKTAAVKDADADVFLVPANEYKAAKQRAGKGLVVIPVTTLQEALDALASVGGDLAGLSSAQKAAA